MNEPTTIIGIDPGASGGVAWTYTDADPFARAENMPATPHDLSDLMGEIMLGSSGSMMAYVEKVHSMPGNGVASMFKFGKGVGVIFGVLAALGIPYLEVSPQKWQKVMTLPAPPKYSTVKAVAKKQRAKYKTDRKRAIKAGMQARYPNLKVTLKTADALGILTYAKETRNNGT